MWMRQISSLLILGIASCSSGGGGASEDTPPVTPTDGETKIEAASFMAFSSVSPGLTSDATGTTKQQIFLYDRKANKTTLLSKSSAGVEGNDDSYSPCISADGKSIGFLSKSTNLVSNDTTTTFDLFLYKTSTNTLTRISEVSGTEANNDVENCSISGDGRYLVFDTASTNLVSGDTNSAIDVFLQDTQTGTLSRISLTEAGAQLNSNSRYPSISADGNYIAFRSDATNLVSGDTNGMPDIFLFNREANTVKRISVDSNQVQSDGSSSTPWISPNGLYVTYTSAATNLVSGDTNSKRDIFVYTISNGDTQRISLSSAAAQATDDSQRPTITNDGKLAVFVTDAVNLVSSDTNGENDIFIRNLETSTTSRLLGDGSAEPNLDNSVGEISSDGKFIGLGSKSSNLISGDTNGKHDFFLYEISTGIYTRVTGTIGNDSGDLDLSPVLNGGVE